MGIRLNLSARLLTCETRGASEASGGRQEPGTGRREGGSVMKVARSLGALALFASAVGAQTFNMTLSGGRETGAGGDPGGRGLAVITIDGTTVRYYIWVRDIAQPTAAHIHGAARGAERLGRRET